MRGDAVRTTWQSGKTVSTGKSSTTVILALGANLSGPWGNPHQTLNRAVAELRTLGVDILAIAPLYSSAPIGVLRQPKFLNTVIICRAPYSIAQILRICKSIERSAGRRRGTRWGARALDIDIILARGSVIGFRRPRHSGSIPGRRPSSVKVPHVEFHRRAFVLQPLVDVAPHAYHPVLHMTARQMLERLPTSKRRGLHRVAPAAFG